MGRKAWLDILKLIAMFLVVVYHTPPRYDNAHEAALFNMGAPVFFFAAGYLFDIARQQGFFAFLRHRARQILVPYTTFFVLFYALWLVVGRRMAGPEEMEIGVLTPLWQFLQGTPDVVLGPFWFLAALFTMQVIYYPIRKYLGGGWPVVVAMLLSLSLFIMPDLPWLRYWNLDKALLYMPIYAVGNCCRQWIDKWDFTKVPAVLVYGLLAIAGLGFLIMVPLNINKEVAYVLAPLAVILVLPLYTAVSKTLSGNCRLDRLARVVAVASITYLGLQNYLIGIIKMVIAKVMDPQIWDDNLVLKVVVALGVMAILYPIAVFFDRRFPWLLGKKASTL